MKKIVLAAMVGAVLSTSSPVFGEVAAVEAPNQIDCNHLDAAKYSTDEFTTIKNLCRRNSEVEAGSITPENIKKWGSLGKEFSTAVVSTAKELGVAANEFLYTPVGFLMAFYFMWDMIGGILIGVPMLIFIWTTYFVVCKKLLIAETTYDYKSYLWGLISIKRPTHIQYKDIDYRVTTYLFLGAVAIFMSMLDIRVLIF